MCGVALLRHAALSLTTIWLLMGFAAPLYIVFDGSFARRKVRSPLVGFILAWTLVAVFSLTTLALLWFSGRKYAIVLALFETIAICGFFPRSRRHVMWVSAVFLGTLASWAMSLGFPYTHLADWLLNATGASALALPAFFLALSLALYLTLTRAIPGSQRNAAIWAALQFAIAIGVFVYLGMRTDNETTLWIPYHQSYFTSAASLVRAHHWLLWDVPSQYGFLSILTLAALPGRTTFDAIHLMTALLLLAQATIVFAVFRARRGGWLNFAFALALCCATFYSSQSQYYPFGARLYPQEGLRFLWPIAALLFVFLRYKFVSAGWRTAALAAGHLCWLLSVLWSFETAIWTTIIWAGYLFVETLECWRQAGRFQPALTAFAKRFGAMAVLLVAAVAVIQMIYRAHFGHGPDWIAYFEFSAIYSSGGEVQYVPAIDAFGAEWAIVVQLAAVGATLLVALRRGAYRVLPVLSACWFALWAMSSYYAGEAFNQHIAMISGVFVFVWAILLWVTESDLRGGVTTLLARLSFVPVSVLLIAYAFGAPSHMRDIRAPFMKGYDANFSAGLPAITGELLTLERKARMRPGDEVLYPNWAIWNKLSTGEILPLERNSDGTVTERVAWLPISPSGAYNAWHTLAPSRRTVYVERYLDDSRNPRGWYITYRQPADCSDLSPRLATVKVVSTPNYRAAYCRLATNFP